MLRKLSLAALAAALLLTIPSLSFAQKPWIHVEVTESGEENTHVKVNLPLSLVQVAIDAAPEKFVSEGRIHLHHVDEDIDVEDLRRIWKELKDAGDAEFVTVESDKENVTVRRDGDLLRIQVDEPEKSERVDIEVPVRVVDALFSGEGETLNLRDALSELSGERGDLVRIDSSDATVRVWIDEKN